MVTFEARQLDGETEDPTDVGQAPAVDRLIVVADEEDPVRRRCQRERKLELHLVDILDFVDQKVGAVTAPAREQEVVRPKRAHCADHQVVEVERPDPRKRLLVGDKGSGNGSRQIDSSYLSRGNPEVDLEPGDPLSSSAQPAGPALGSSPARVSQDLEAEGVEGPDPKCAIAQAEWSQCLGQPLAQLGRRPPIECNRGNRPRINADRDQPCNPGDQGRRLAAAGRGDAQDRPEARGGSGALIGRKIAAARPTSICRPERSRGTPNRSGSDENDISGRFSRD